MILLFTINFNVFKLRESIGISEFSIVSYMRRRYVRTKSLHMWVENIYAVRILRAFPYNNRHIAAEIQIQNILRFIWHFEAIAFANDHMPISTEFFVHCLFDWFSCQLFPTSKQQMKEKKHTYSKINVNSFTFCFWMMSHLLRNYRQIFHKPLYSVQHIRPAFHHSYPNA